MLPLAALGLLVLAGLMAERIGPARGERGSAPGGPAPEVTYPRDRPRLRPVRPPSAAAAPRSSAAPERSARPLDRFERAIGGGDSMVVAEVNALRHSPLAEALLRCRGPEIDEARAELKTETGLDLFEDVDRVMASEGNIVVSGNFADLALPEDLDATPYGDEARIFRSQGTDEEEGRFALVGDDLLILGPDPESVQSAVDRVEGRSPAHLPDAILEGGAEIFGPLDGSLLQQLLKDSPLADRAEDLSGASFRALVDDHVAVSLDLEAESSAAAAELQGLIQGGLSALRIEAATRGDNRWVELLRASRVDLEGSGLALDLPVPGPLILDFMGCDAEGRPKAE
ncbi:MAG: hypothetical protein AAFU79_09735 [Myxococcota bacterium]